MARLDPFCGTSENSVVQLPTDLDQMTQTIGTRMGGDQGILYFIREAFVQQFSLGLFVPVQIPRDPTKLSEIRSESAVLLFQFSNFAVGGAVPVGVVERLAEEVQQYIYGFELDSSSILRYIATYQIEGGSRKAVDRTSEASLVVRITLWLHGQLVA
jgi:hypothetical protein